MNYLFTKVADIFCETSNFDYLCTDKLNDINVFINK